jgi:hypothetical protein
MLNSRLSSDYSNSTQRSPYDAGPLISTLRVATRQQVLHAATLMDSGHRAEGIETSLRVSKPTVYREMAESREALTLLPKQRKL